MFAYSMKAKNPVVSTAIGKSKLFITTKVVFCLQTRNAGAKSTHASVFEKTILTSERSG